MTGWSLDMTLTAAAAALIGLLLLLVMASGRLGARFRDSVAGIGFCAALALFAWGTWQAAIVGDWVNVAFFCLVGGIVIWRSFRAYRRWSARRSGGEGLRPTP
jgi:hypothetical protein